MAEKVLLVDDEPGILRALGRLLKREGYDIDTATGGEEAVQKLRGEEYSVIISDYMMPGMSGIELLQEAKKLQPETVRMVITGYADLETAIDAINKGDIYRFIKKPWDDKELVQLLRDAVEMRRIKLENAILQAEVTRQNEALKETALFLDQRVKARTAELIEAVNSANKLNSELQQQNLGIIRAFSSLMDLRHPLLGEHCRRVARKTAPLCEKLGIGDTGEIQQITLAALLHDIGKIGLPDVTLAKSESQLVGQELVEVRSHPLIGQAQVQAVPELVPVGMLIRYHHENIDGTGYPDGLTGETIPFGARVLRVLDAFDRKIFRGGRWRNELTDDILADMHRHIGKKYDHDVLLAFVEVTEHPRFQFLKRVETAITINNLSVGMILSRDIVTKKGQLILPADEELTQTHIDKIKNYLKLASIRKEVYIYDE